MSQCVINKSEIKTGMIVEMRDGLCYIVLNGFLVSPYIGGGMHLDWLTDELIGDSSKGYNDKYAIERVYKLKDNACLTGCSLDYWFRKEKDRRGLKQVDLVWERVRYPLYCKLKGSTLVVKFDGLESGTVITPDEDRSWSVGERSCTWRPHDQPDWVAVTPEHTVTMTLREFEEITGG